MHNCTVVRVREEKFDDHNFVVLIQAVLLLHVPDEFPAQQLVGHGGFVTRLSAERHTAFRDYKSRIRELGCII